MGASCQASQCYSMQDSVLCDIIDGFSPPAAWIALSGTVDASQQVGRSLQVSCSLISVWYMVSLEAAES